MGMRFKKSIGLGKGARLNLGKGSVGVSVGAKGARYSVNSRRGVTTSVGIPGTGVSYSNTSGGGGSHRSGGESSGGASGAAIGLLVVVFLYVLIFGGGYLLLRGVRAEREAEPDWFDTSTSVSDSATAGTGTTVTITPDGQTAPIDVIADGVEAYLADKGYPVTSTKQDADHSRVECVVSVPGLSDTDGRAKTSNWDDVRATLISLADGAQGAVPDQGDYTVLVSVQSATGDNLLVARDNKILYDKFQVAAEAGQRTEKTVYVSASGSKYHSKPNCGNMSSASRVTIAEAQSRGLTACSRCW